MDHIDLNYIIEGKAQVFDWLFLRKVGIDGDRNCVYLIQDKFRDRRYGKFMPISEPTLIKQQIAKLLIYQNSNDSKLIQPIHDFTVSKDKRLIFVTMPVPPRTLYSVIKDTKADLRVRLSLVQNLVGGAIYMHSRRKSFFGYLRPEAIVIHGELNAFDKGKMGGKRKVKGDSKDLYPRFNSFSTLMETPTKSQNWKWTLTEHQYYDAPEVWAEIQKKKRNQNPGEQEPKPVTYRYTDKSDVWALGLILVEVLSATTIEELLGSSETAPGKLLKQITVRQKLLKNQVKTIPIEPQNPTPIPSPTAESFYEKLFKYIDCFAMRSIIEKMLSLKPDQRPTMEEVLRVVERLDVVDKKGKNIGKVFMYNRSLRNLKMCNQEKQKEKEENKCEEDDKKSVISIKSVRSGKSSRSHYSQSRKRIPQTFPTLLHSRQALTDFHPHSSSALQKTFPEDIKNRLPTDINFTPPPCKMIVKKDDKAVALGLRGDSEEEIREWLVEKALGDFTGMYYQEGKGFVEKVPLFRDPGRVKNYSTWLHNLSMESSEGRNFQDYPKNPNSPQDFYPIPYGPALKKIPTNAATLKQLPYNENLSNYHHLSLEYTKHHRSLQACLNRNFVHAAQSQGEVEVSEKSLQFILNLKYCELESVPRSIDQYLTAPNCVKYLSLSHNKIGSLENLCGESLERNLMVLDLSWNCLKAIDAELWNFHVLEQVYLMENSIELIQGFEEENEGDCGKETNYRGENQDQYSREISCERREKKVCTNLKRLYLNSNKIRVIESIFNLPSIEIVSIGKNPLSQNLANIEAIDKLRSKKIKLFY